MRPSDKIIKDGYELVGELNTENLVKDFLNIPCSILLNKNTEQHVVDNLFTIFLYGVVSAVVPNSNFRGGLQANEILNNITIN